MQGQLSIFDYNKEEQLNKEKTITKRDFDIVHCFFEQSGTFKNEFIKLGFKAYDYDILNNYGQTDYQVDLFKEIERSYRGGAERI